MTLHKYMKTVQAKWFSRELSKLHVPASAKAPAIAERNLIEELHAAFEKGEWRGSNGNGESVSMAVKKRSLRMT